MKRIFSILFAVVLVLSFSLIPATPAAAADLNVPSPHSTIQDAIDAASSSDTIIVAAGTYEEDLVIPEGLDNLTLAGTSGAIIKGVAMTLATSWPTVAPNIDIRADGVTISGFTIRGPDVNPGSYSHLQLDWENPPRVAFYEGLAAFAYARLAKEHRTPIIQLDHHRCQCQDGRT